MQETGFSKDFSREDPKKSGQYCIDTVSSSNVHKNSGIYAERKLQAQIVSPPKQIIENQSKVTSNHSQPLSPPCSNKIKTLVDLDCKSINSSGDGDRTSSYHVSIAASLNSSKTPSAITDHDRIFRTLKQMTLKNITEEGAQPKLLMNRLN